MTLFFTSASKVAVGCMCEYHRIKLACRFVYPGVSLIIEVMSLLSNMQF